MINKIVSTAAFSLILASSAFAGENSKSEVNEKSNLVRTNPFSLLSGGYSLGFEHGIKRDITLGLQLENSAIRVNEIEGGAQSVSVGIRYYNQGFSNTSSYYSGSVGMVKMDFGGKVEGKEFNARGDGYLVSASYGKQYVWDSGLNLSGGFGFAYTSLKMDGDYQLQDRNQTDRVSTDVDKFLPFIDLSIGYQF